MARLLFPTFPAGSRTADRPAASAHARARCDAPGAHAHEPQPVAHPASLVDLGLEHGEL